MMTVLDIGDLVLFSSAVSRGDDDGSITPDIEERMMLDCNLDQENSIVLVRPDTALDKNDFVKLAQVVDPQIEAHGDLAGLIIDAPRFPGWDSLGAMVTHIRFVRDHHKHVKKIAVVTDSHLGDFAEHLAAHFISAEIRQFPGGHLEQARAWIIGGS